MQTGGKFAVVPESAGSQPEKAKLDVPPPPKKLLVYCPPDYLGSDDGVETCKVQERYASSGCSNQMNDDYDYDDYDSGNPCCFSDGKNSQWMMLTIGFIFWSVSVAGGFISLFSKSGHFSSNVITLVGVIIGTAVAISMVLQQQMRDTYNEPLQCNNYNGYLG